VAWTPEDKDVPRTDVADLVKKIALKKVQIIEGLQIPKRLKPEMGKTTFAQSCCKRRLYKHYFMYSFSHICIHQSFSHFPILMKSKSHFTIARNKKRKQRQWSGKQWQQLRGGKSSPD